MQAWLEVNVAEEADEEHDEQDALDQGVQNLQAKVWRDHRGARSGTPRGKQA